MVLIDYENREYVDLLDPVLETDEHFLFIRRLMIHKKVITHYLKEVKPSIEPVTNMFGFQRYLKLDNHYSYHFKYSNTITFNSHLT